MDLKIPHQASHSASPNFPTDEKKIENGKDHPRKSTETAVVNDRLSSAILGSDQIDDAGKENRSEEIDIGISETITKAEVTPESPIEPKDDDESQVVNPRNWQGLEHRCLIMRQIVGEEPQNEGDEVANRDPCQVPGEANHAPKADALTKLLCDGHL